MKQANTRLTAEHRREDGGWEEIGTALIDGWECEQIALILSGIDPGAFAALPATAQARVLQNIDDNLPPSAAMI